MQIDRLFEKFLDKHNWFKTCMYPLRWSPYDLFEYICLVLVVLNEEEWSLPSAREVASRQQNPFSSKKSKKGSRKEISSKKSKKGGRKEISSKKSKKGSRKEISQTESNRGSKKKEGAYLPWDVSTWPNITEADRERSRNAIERLEEERYRLSSM